MKQRTTPLAIPGTRIYVELEVPNRGTHHFRLPRIARAVELLDLMPQEEIQQTSETLKTGTLMANLRHYATLEERAALVVGSLWHHQELELESDRNDGAALAEEFHEAGYTPAELYSICLSLHAPLTHLLFPVTEAKDPDGFFDETHGGAATPQ